MKVACIGSVCLLQCLGSKVHCFHLGVNSVEQLLQSIDTNVTWLASPHVAVNNQ